MWLRFRRLESWRHACITKKMAVRMSQPSTTLPWQQILPSATLGCCERRNSDRFLFFFSFSFSKSLQLKCRTLSYNSLDPSFVLSPRSMMASADDMASRAKRQDYFKGLTCTQCNGKFLIRTYWMIFNLGVCILLRVLDQVQGFPSIATLFQ
jgi:hypothetical protein